MQKTAERSLRVPLERSKSSLLHVASSEGVQALWSDTRLRNHVPVSQTSNSNKKKTAKSSTGKLDTECSDVRSNSTDQNIKTGSQFGCQTCEKKFQLKEAANQHMAATGHGNPNIPCKTCNKKFSTQSAAIEHMAATGHGNPNFSCKTCTKKFSTQSAAIEHMTATGHGSPNIPCKTCNKKFSTQSAAIEHMAATGHGNPNFSCKTCTKKFYTQSAAIEHMAAVRH